ncbi:MAG: hypothetical protein HZLCBSQH_001857 [Candidatus Fervidibacterota bacterium]
MEGLKQATRSAAPVGQAAFPLGKPTMSARLSAATLPPTIKLENLLSAACPMAPQFQMHDRPSP